MNQGKHPAGDSIQAIAQHPARLAQRAFEQSHAGVVITDADGVIVLANNAFCAIAGCDRAETVGWPIAHFYTSLRTRPEPIEDDQSRQERETPSWQQEVLCRRDDGESMPVLMMVDALLDEERRPQYYLHTFILLTSPEGGRTGSRHWIHVDPMTGLPNWLLLRDRLNHAIAQAERADSTLALLFIDIDRFKAINDAVGHIEGDRMLGELAQRLQRAVRSKDTLARLGSDQFVVLLEKDGIAEAAQIVAERLQETLEPPFVSSGRYLLMSASIGIALYPDDAQDEETLITAARSAMYTARKKGPGRLAFVDHRLTARLKEKHRIESLLSEAIHLPDQHFLLHYQPEFDRASGRCTGLESVLRWKQPKRWHEPPGAYLEVIAQLGLGVRLNRWMIQGVINDHHQWREDGSPLGELPVAVPLCESHLAHDTFDRRPLDHFLRQQSTVSFDWLTLKLPGHGLGSHLDTATHMLKRIEQLGIRLAVDDIGASPIDLGWLSRLPFTKATIAVGSIVQRPGGERLIEASCRLLEALDIEAVIAGVDDAALAARVEGVSARLIQGDLYCPALPADELGGWLSEHNAPCD
ncbi:diguanylate cyclase [Billgrantia pellis]|uniref:Diguanylate cyclase n=1 Tax=Billgrantia pellis TaxID=2606936 RepID=A0A7V7G2M9_9GAMM|nr:GGDEF and EAL domain-containing protein [Halomonas pellis]KAA0014455.1 diguanylate cyclase [Halomonas pellis]